MDYDDLFVMLKDIQEYVKGHPGCEILSRDDPMERRLGFTTRSLEESWRSKIWNHPRVRWGLIGKIMPFLKPKRRDTETWEISLVRLRTSLNNRPKQIRDLYYGIFTSPYHRERLAKALTNGARPESAV